MSLSYRILYGIGVTPWEGMADTPTGGQIIEAFAREENGTEPPYGPVLDLGCGSGIWSVEMARRGWDVTGVDNVPKAIRRARGRAQEAGVEPRFIQGDVTDLGAAGVGSGYRFLVDFGCFHDALSDSQRLAEGREATAAAAPDATMVMAVMKPGRRGPLPRGASRQDIETAFPSWEIAEEIPLDATGAPGWVVKAQPRLCRLTRR